MIWELAKGNKREIPKRSFWVGGENNCVLCETLCVHRG